MKKHILLLLLPIYSFCQNNTTSTFLNLEQLRASGTKSIAAITLGYDSPGDGGNAMYYWDEKNTKPDDSALIIKPKGVSVGRYVYLPQNNMYELKALGIKATGSSHDNFYRMQSIINSIPDNVSVNFHLGAGSQGYYFSKGLDFTGKTINFSGDGYQTQLFFPSKTTGITLNRTRERQSQYRTFKDFAIYGTKDGKDGKDEKGKQSKNAADYHYHGISMNSRNILSNIFIRGFSGDGLHLYGNIRKDYSNVAASVCDNIQVAQCGNGVYIGDADASAITFINLDTRDNDGIGVYDDSFYGNIFIGGEHHNNALGHFYLDKENAQTTFAGTYFETGNPSPSYSKGYVTFIGGWNGDANGEHVSHLTGDVLNRVFAGKEGSYERVGIGTARNGEPMLTFQTAPNEGFVLKNNGGSSRYSNNWAYTYGNPEGKNATSLLDFHGYNVTRSANNDVRGIRTPLIGFNYHYEGMTLVQYAPDLNSLISSPYRVGDKVWNTNYSTGAPLFWICTKAGSIGDDSHLTGKMNGNTIVLSEQAEGVQVGDVVQIGNTVRTITSKAKDNMSVVLNEPFPPVSGNIRLKYVAPTWQAVYALTQK